MNMALWAFIFAGGDYLSNPQYLGICELDYYTNAIKKSHGIAGKLSFCYIQQ